MRKACSDCTIKHLVQAMILMDEALLGYPLHRYLAIGHLAEAESEYLGVDISIAQQIREYRQEYTLGTEVNLMEVIQRILLKDG